MSEPKKDTSHVPQDTPSKGEVGASPANPFEVASEDPSVSSNASNAEKKIEEKRKDHQKDDPKATPDPVKQESVSEAKKEEVPADSFDGGDELLVEEDGDFFWMLQRIIWGMVKTIFLLAGVGVLIWIIWSPQKEDIESFVEDITSEEKMEEAVSEISLKEGETEKEVPIQGQPSKNSQSEGSVLSAVQWNRWIEKSRRAEVAGTLGDSTRWIGEARAFFDIPMRELFHGETREARESKINQTLPLIRNFLQRSHMLRKKLIDQITEFSQKENVERGNLERSSQSLQQKVELSDAMGIQRDLAQKIDAEKKATSYASEVKVRNALLAQIEMYDRRLRNMYDNIQANRSAIIENVQVVNFPEDPFDRVLTPAEWRQQSPGASQ